MPSALFLAPNNPLFIPFWVLLLGFGKAQIGFILEICHSLAIVHEKAVQILYCDTLPSFKSCHWIPLSKFRLGANHTEALKDTLVLHLLTLCIGACVPVPYLSD